MKNKKILRGSFASRVLFIAILFLVLPFLFLSLFLYKEDSRIKAKNNRFILKVLMKKTLSIFDMIINHEGDFLSGTSFLLKGMENPTILLKDLARREEVSAFLHVRRDEEGEYVSDMTSDIRYLGKNYTALIKESQKGVSLILDEENLFFFLIWGALDGSEAWITLFSLDRFMLNFPIEQEVLYPSLVAFLAEDDSVMASTDTALKKQGKVRIHRKNNAYFFLGNKKYIALKRLVPQTNFSLLIAAPQMINFVDIPYFLLKVGLILGLILVVGGGGGVWLTVRLSKPLKCFIDVMARVGEGDLTQRYIPDRMGFEFNVIGEIFNNTLQSLIRNMEKAERERIAKETYATELKIGEEVQSAILPEELPHFSGLDIAAHFIAAKEMGGDFYDFLVHDKLMLSIADAAGKGISACLYSLTLRSILRSFGTIYHDLDVIVNKTNELFCVDTKTSGMFVTAFIALFDPVTKKLDYTNCGHLPALLLRGDNFVTKLHPRGMAFGVVSFEWVATRHIQLESGDLLVFFTDGVIEACNAKQEFFGEKRLVEFLQIHRKQRPQYIVDHLVKEVMRFVGDVVQYDDLTVIVVRIQ